MKKALFLGLLSVMILGCSVKKNTGQAFVNQKEADIYVQTINQADLRKHLTIIASDEFEGRETAMPGQKKAAQYIANHFESIGLKKGVNDTSYFQSFPVAVKDPAKVEIKVDGKRLAFLEDFFYLGSFNDTNINNLEVVYLNYGIDSKRYSDYKEIDVKGKVVVVKEGVPNKIELNEEWDSWRKKIDAAQKNGAVALFTIKSDFKTRLERIKFYIQNPTMELHNKGNRKINKFIPNFFISDSVATNYFKVDTNKTIQNLSCKVDLKLTIDQILSSENVLGFIEGTDKKEEIVVITAHYDHIGYDAGEICNGADDDGSGTVAVLELAEAFKKAQKAGNGPRRSMLFMTVSGEEKGLLGSQYYTENPIYDLKNTVVDLNIDMIGRVDDLHDNNNYVYLIGSDKISSDLHEISEKANAEKIKMTLDYTYNDENDPNRFYYRSDHYNFAKNDIPVIFYFSGTHEDYHKPTDDVEKIDFEKLERTTKLVFYTAWEIANRKENLNRIKK